MTKILLFYSTQKYILFVERKVNLLQKANANKWQDNLAHLHYTKVIGPFFTTQNFRTDFENFVLGPVFNR